MKQVSSLETIRFKDRFATATTLHITEEDKEEHKIFAKYFPKLRFQGVKFGSVSEILDTPPIICERIDDAYIRMHFTLDLPDMFSSLSKLKKLEN